MKLRKALIKLNYTFDADRILAEIPSIWTKHFVETFAKAGSDAIPLVTTNGEQNNDHEYPMLPTPELDGMEYTKSIWSILGIEFERSRFMKIKPKGEVPQHYDAHRSWDDKIRLHIPVKTNNKVIFTCDDMAVNMKKGECWALDNSRLHGVINGGNEERIHLVIDAPIGFIE